MIKRITTLFLIASCPLLLTDCATSRLANQLSTHRENLMKAALGDINPEKKMDILAYSMVNMMHEALRPMNPKKGVAYVTDYGKQNQESIDKILKDIGEWQKDLNIAEQIALGVRIIQKPYLKDLIELGPKFKQKYNQIKFIMDLTGKLKKGLFDLGAQQLDF